MTPKRIFVVDDSFLYQRILSEIVNEHPHMEVVGVAANGKIALEMMNEAKPDLVTLDILMPGMDGIQTLIELCRKCPDARTIMISSLVSEGSDAALDALALGANDYVQKPNLSDGVDSIRDKLRDNLLPRIEALCGIDSKPLVKPDPSISTVSNVVGSTQSQTRSQARSCGSRPDLIVIGVSTGGPEALARLLTHLPEDLEVPICIVQHMPPEFTGKLAARLNDAGGLKVREAEIGDTLCAGTVYIAPGDFHMVLDRVGSDVVVKLNQNPEENSCRPSVDPLFRSAASLYGSRCLGVVLTGMGQDGLKGSEALFAAGSSILVQDKASSVVWGMPRLVALAGLADEQLPLKDMGSAIMQRVRPGGVRRDIKLNDGTHVGMPASEAANADFLKQGTSQGQS